MVKRLESGLKEQLESTLLSKLECSPSMIDWTCSSLILCCDAALQLKERGYETAMAIKNDGILYSKIFEMMGYNYSEIDYSYHKRCMQEPVIAYEDLEKARGKKVILCDRDIDSGITLQKVNEYLTLRHIEVGGAYIGSDFWLSFSFDLDKRFWIVGKSGLRKVAHKNLKDRTRIPDNFEIFGATKPTKINNATRRVFEYLRSARKI